MFIVCELCGCYTIDEDDGICGECRNRLEAREEELLGDQDEPGEEP
jgi:hypothetical protein